RRGAWGRGGWGGAASPRPRPPWPRLTYEDAMARYGSDKPDLRFGLEIHDLGAAVAGTEFRVFQAGVVRGLNAGAREASRRELDELTEVVKRFGAGGLVWAFVEDGGSWRSPARALSDDERRGVATGLGTKPGGLSMSVAAASADVVAPALGGLRLELGRRYDLIDRSRHELLWVIDFPMFEWNAGEKRWDALHHPFTAPVGSFEDPGAL